MAVVVHISVLVCYHECLSNFISLCSLVWSHVCYCFLSPIVMNPNAISYCHCVWSHIYIYRYQCCDAISRIRSVCLLSRPWLYIYTSVFTVRFLVSWFRVYIYLYIYHLLPWSWFWEYIYLYIYQLLPWILIQYSYMSEYRYTNVLTVTHWVPYIYIYIYIGVLLNIYLWGSLSAWLYFTYGCTYILHLMLWLQFISGTHWHAPVSICMYLYIS